MRTSVKTWSDPAKVIQRRTAKYVDIQMDVTCKVNRMIYYCILLVGLIQKSMCVPLKERHFSVSGFLSRVMLDESTHIAAFLLN